MKGKHDKNYDSDNLKDENNAERESDKLQDQDRDTIEKWQDTRLNDKQLEEDGKTGLTDEELELYARESKVYETMAKNLMDKVKEPIAESADNDAHGAKTGHYDMDIIKKWTETVKMPEPLSKENWPEVHEGYRALSYMASTPGGMVWGDHNTKPMAQEERDKPVKTAIGMLNEMAEDYIASTDPIQTPVGGIADIRVGKLLVYETLEQILADVWKISLKEITIQELAMKIQRTIDTGAFIQKDGTC